MRSARTTRRDLRRLAVIQTPLKDNQQSWYEKSLDPGQKTRPHNNQQKKKKKISKIVDFAVPADHIIIPKESEKKDKYLDLARELKKLWNMKVTIVPIVIGALGTITKGLLKGVEDLEIGGRVETIQTTALLKSARILWLVLETCCHSNSSVKPSVNADVKKTLNGYIIIIIID